VSRVSLLDVNLLVALFDPNHIHHDVAHDWFADHRADGWATCPVTENGFVRVLSNPSYGGDVSRVADLVGRLRTFCSANDHTFWEGGVSLHDEGLFRPQSTAGHRQLTACSAWPDACVAAWRRSTARFH
jgi:predicted nucleic acid-binding protein